MFEEELIGNDESLATRKVQNGKIELVKFKTRMLHDFVQSKFQLTTS
jgi:hypothetical protein